MECMLPVFDIANLFYFNEHESLEMLSEPRLGKYKHVRFPNFATPPCYIEPHQDIRKARLCFGAKS
jgi:hypothetical protein